jgi:hypothetical protein
MKKTRNPFFKTICSLVIIFAFTCTMNISAQVDPPATDVADTIPLDGGLAILLIGAAAFGIKKLRDNKKGNI